MDVIKRRPEIEFACSRSQREAWNSRKRCSMRQGTIRASPGQSLSFEVRKWVGKDAWDKTAAKDRASSFEGRVRGMWIVVQEVQGLWYAPRRRQVETSVSRWRKVAIYGRLIDY